MKADKEKISSICKKVKEFYFGEKEIGKDTTDNVVDVRFQSNVFVLEIAFKLVKKTTESIFSSFHFIY